MAHLARRRPRRHRRRHSCLALEGFRPPRGLDRLTALPGRGLAPPGYLTSARTPHLTPPPRLSARSMHSAIFIPCRSHTMSFQPFVPSSRTGKRACKTAPPTNIPTSAATARPRSGQRHRRLPTSRLRIPSDSRILSSSSSCLTFCASSPNSPSRTALGSRWICSNARPAAPVRPTTTGQEPDRIEGRIFVRWRPCSPLSL